MQPSTAYNRIALSLIAALALGFLSSATLAASGSDQANPQVFPEPVFVSLQKSGAVERLPDGTVFDGFPGAHYLDLGPDGDTLVVSGFKTGHVYIADAKTGEKRSTLQLGKVVQGVKIAPDGSYALAVNASGGSVDVIDLQEGKVTSAIAVGPNPHNVRFSRDGRLAYVTVQGSDTLAVVDMQRMKVVKHIPVSGLSGAHNLDISPDGRRLWIRSHPSSSDDTGHVVMVDLAAGKVDSSLAVGKFHGGVDMEAPSNVVLATDIGGDTVDVMDRNALAVIATVDVGAGPHGVRMSPNGRWAYVTATRADEVDVIDMHDLKVVKRISTDGQFPFWVALAGNE